MIGCYFENIEDVLLEHLQKSRTTIKIAVAWFVNYRLFESVLAKAQTGIHVEVIINNDTMNNRRGGLPYQQLIDSDAGFFFSDGGSLMHHKFCIIDNETVITGSYNWTYAARKNRENIVLTDDIQVVRQYREEFSKLINAKERVYNIYQYLKEHPPLLHENGGFAEIADEIESSIDEYFIEQPFEDISDVIDYGIGLQPSNISLQKKKAVLYAKRAADVEELSKRYPRLFLWQIAQHFEWNTELLTLYSDKLFWPRVERNENTEWDSEKLDLFYNKIFNQYFRSGRDIPDNKRLFLSITQLRHYQGFHRWPRNKDFGPLLNDNSIDPTIVINVQQALSGYTIQSTNNLWQQRYEDDDYPWSKPELLEHLEALEFWPNKASAQIPWDQELLQAVKSHPEHQYGVFCSTIQLSSQRLHDLTDYLDWHGIVRNEHIVWSEKLFYQFEDKILPYIKELCSTQHFPWREAFITKYKDKVSFINLAGNPGVPWRLDMIEKYMPTDGPVTNPESNCGQYISALADNPTVWENIFKPVVDSAFLNRVKKYMPDDKDIVC